MTRRIAVVLCLIGLTGEVFDQELVSIRSLTSSAVAAEPVIESPSVAASATTAAEKKLAVKAEPHAVTPVDYWSLLFVLALSTLIGLGVIVKVSRLLHTPLMSLTNAISAIAVVGAIIVTGGDHSVGIRIFGFIALFASTTNIVSGFMITDRMLKMFKQPSKEAKP